MSDAKSRQRQSTKAKPNTAMKRPAGATEGEPSPKIFLNSPEDQIVVESLTDTNKNIDKGIDKCTQYQKQYYDAKLELMKQANAIKERIAIAKERKAQAQENVALAQDAAEEAQAKAARALEAAAYALERIAKAQEIAGEIQHRVAEARPSVADAQERVAIALEAINNTMGRWVDTQD